MIVFPIQSLMDEQGCYDYLLAVLSPTACTILRVIRFWRSKRAMIGIASREWCIGARPVGQSAICLPTRFGVSPGIAVQPSC